MKPATQANTNIVSMATVVMICPVTGCNAGEGALYKTEKVSEATAITMLKMHVDNSHQAA